jgi:GxxExxY protein
MNNDPSRQSGSPPPPAIRQPKSAAFLHAEISRAIIGALFEVHGELGAGFLERVYANAVSVALRVAGHGVRREVPFEIVFRGEVIGRYVADLVVDSKVVVEVKAARGIDAAHRAQLLNYLRASGLEVGLLLNFGASAQFKRVVLSSRLARRSR